jgi:hypothetical protein
MSSSTADVGPARSPRADKVLGNADLAGLITSMLNGDDDLWLATRAAHSLCLASKAVRAAVLASVQRVRMDAPLPAVLQQMASLASLRVRGPGPLDPSQLRQLTRLQANGISSVLAVSAIMQLTRLRELRMDVEAEDSAGMMLALQCISRLGSLSSLHIRFPKMKQLPDTISQLAYLTSLHLGGCSRLQQAAAAAGHHWAAHSPQQLAARRLLSCWATDNPQQPEPGQLQQPAAAARHHWPAGSPHQPHLGSCSGLRQLPDTISQLAALSSLHLGGCSGLQQLPDSIGQLTALTSLYLDSCSGLQQLPDAIGQLAALSRRMQEPAAAACRSGRADRHPRAGPGGLHRPGALVAPACSCSRPRAAGRHS